MCRDLIYCRSGNFLVVIFSRISDFGIFHEVFTKFNIRESSFSLIALL